MYSNTQISRYLNNLNYSVGQNWQSMTDIKLDVEDNFKPQPDFRRIFEIKSKDKCWQFYSSR